VVSVHDTFLPASAYPGARARDNAGFTSASGGYRSTDPVSTGTAVLVPLVGIPASSLAGNAVTAAAPTGAGLHGTVWLDFTQGGGGTSGAIDPTETTAPPAGGTRSLTRASSPRRTTPTCSRTAT
jgi:alpha-glucoside transport system permease protein